MQDKRRDNARIQSVLLLCNVCLLVLAIIANGGCVRKTTTLSVDQSTPEAAIRSLISAYSQGDVHMMRALVKPGDQASEPFIADFEKFAAQDGRARFTDVVISMVENDGVQARATVSGRIALFSGRTGQALGENESGDFYTLVKVNNRWYFVGLGEANPPGWVQGQ